MLQITPPSERQATPLAAAPARMAQSVPMARDTRLDVFRAICLIMIFINHVPGQYLEHLTSKNFGFSDSAEAFVLISGLSAGLAYGRKFVPGKRIATTIKIWRRAFTLYVAHIMTSIITLAIFAGGALYFGRQELVGEINIRPLVDHTEQGIVAMVLLGHQLGYNNILSMYAIVLLVLPGMLLLRNVSSGLLIAVSGALWLSAGLFHIVPANFLDEGYWFLNPFSWQFLFAIGIVCMMRTHQGRPLPRHPLLIGIASAYVLISLFWVAGSLWHFDMSFGLPAVLTGFDKTFLSAPRLLHVLAVAYLCAVLPVISRWARLPIDHPLVRVGRHSLPIFILGTILAMLGQVLMFVTGHDPLWGTLFVMVGIALHFAYARYLDWLSTLTKAVAPVAA